MMGTIKIYVSRKGNSKKLKLRDSQGHNPGDENITTDVDTNDKIVWELDNNSGLTSLNGIKKVLPGDPCYKKKSVSVLIANPTPDDGKYIGTVVSSSPGKGKFENYMIGFKIPGDDEVYWSDPKLKMNK